MRQGRCPAVGACAMGAQACMEKEEEVAAYECRRVPLPAPARPRGAHAAAPYRRRQLRQSRRRHTRFVRLRFVHAHPERSRAPAGRPIQNERDTATASSRVFMQSARR